MVEVAGDRPADAPPVRPSGHPPKLQLAAGPPHLSEKAWTTKDNICNEWAGLKLVRMAIEQTCPIFCQTVSGLPATVAELATSSAAADPTRRPIAAIVETKVLGVLVFICGFLPTIARHHLFSHECRLPDRDSCPNTTMAAKVRM